VKVRLNRDSYAHLTEGDDENDTPFRPGMSATVDILTAREMGVMAAPIQAVTSREAGFGDDSDEEEQGGEADESRDDAQLGVFVLREGKASWTPVETGIQDSRFVAITGDVAEDATLITGPYDVVSRSLNDGDDVEPK
jgi:HlyD family secretion protein